MRILLAGHRSFAARGLSARLQAAGHEVTCFSRGAEYRDGDVVTGSVLALPEHPALQDSFDAVINLIVLKGDSVEQNRMYARALLRFCSDRRINRLVHVSSVSVYPSSRKVVNESTGMEADPARRGTYGAWKIAADAELIENKPQDLHLVLVRPGFILGPGLVNPIVGNAFRLPSNRLLCLGSSRAILPVISRGLLHEALVRALQAPIQHTGDPTVVLLVNPESPTRLEYLEVCCQRLGCGTGVTRLPVALWLTAAAAAEVGTWLAGKSNLTPLRKVRGVCSRQVYDPSATEERLGMDFRFDWRRELVHSMEGQRSELQVPATPLPSRPAPGGRVDFLGVGRIVGQRHLPALRRLGHRGELRGYDLRSGLRFGIEVRSLSDAEFDGAALVVVASPGPVHAEALELLRDFDGPVVVEKPLCYTHSELERWRSFASARDGPVYVLHSYRYEDNVREMFAQLQRNPPGRVIRVDVLFQSPPVAAEMAGWLRRERDARTLLMDYSFHFLDLACMLGNGRWVPGPVRWSVNQLGETSVIEGRLEGSTHPVTFCLRQGFVPRTARVEYVFQNYTATLRFFPELLTLQTSAESFWHHARTAWRGLRVTAGKTVEKLFDRTRAAGHTRILGAALGGQRMPDLEVEALAPFYEGLFELAGVIYGEGTPKDGR